MPIVGITPPEVWSDLDHRIIQDGQGAVKKVTNIGAVVSSIDNILGTIQGERVMLPPFAARLAQVIFEPMTEDLINFISREVKDVIERWDDRVDVTGVSIFSDPDSNFVDINISFRVKGYDEIFNTDVRFGANQ